MWSPDAFTPICAVKFSIFIIDAHTDSDPYFYRLVKPSVMTFTMIYQNRMSKWNRVVKQVDCLHVC